nr:MAG TPA: hypothetical protein [Caudoviricetes sp.]
MCARKSSQQQRACILSPFHDITGLLPWTGQISADSFSVIRALMLSVDSCFMVLQVL